MEQMTKQQTDAARAYFAAIGRELLSELPTTREVQYPNTREEQEARAKS